MYGDVDFENVRDKCEWITPPIGGVGGLTVAVLMQNLWNSFKISQNYLY